MRMSRSTEERTAWAPLRSVRAVLAAVLIAGAGVSGPACARHFTTQGLVLAVDRPGAVVTISHEAMPGFMNAMAMPFDVRDEAREALSSLAPPLAPGDRVRFRLSVKSGRSWVDRLEIISAAPVDAGLQTTPAVPVLVPVGAPVPEFSLLDQSASSVTLSSLRGKVVVVNFIYTRCPLPDYCPRMVANFRALRDRFADRMARDLVLLTVSFDPKYDTPARLAAYAVAERAGGPGWYFLTGDSASIERVCNAFGIQYFPEEGLITHTLQTAVIDREGRLAATVEGKDFDGRQLGDLVSLALTGSPGR